LNLEFLQGINRRLNNEVRFVQQIGQVGVVVDAVEQKVVLYDRAPLELNP